MKQVRGNTKQTTTTEMVMMKMIIRITGTLSNNKGMYQQTCDLIEPDWVTEIGFLE